MIGVPSNGRQPNDRRPKDQHAMAEPKANGKPVRIGIAGLGRSGWNIHAKTLRAHPGLFEIASVMDPDADRRREAERELGSTSHQDFEGLIGEPDLDVIVIASPSHLHCAHALASIAQGRHVVVEKPFAMDADEADKMIDAAEHAGVVLAPFQNRRYEPHFRKVLDLVRSGALGDVLQIRMCWHRFTRRWDWQAMKQFGGGALFNNGTHLLDQAMDFFEGIEEPEIMLDLHRGLSMGDAEEHMKLVLRSPGLPTVDIEYSNACAFEQDRWHIMGTAGGLTGTQTHLDWKTVDWATMPERVVDEGPAAGRKYPAEEIRWENFSWDAPESGPTPYEMFYFELYNAVRTGSAMLVTPESVRRYVRVLDRCRAGFEAVS